MKDETEIWEPVSKNYRVLVSREHSFSTDTILLAHFSSPRLRETGADLGTGCGLIPILWKVRGAQGKLYGVEIQRKAAAQAERTMEENGLSGQISILRGDARRLNEIFSAGQLDFIACNPPYKAPGAGILNEKDALRTARHEEALTLSQLAENAAYALRFGGRFFLCLRPERLAEAIRVLGEKKLEPKRLRLVQQRREKAPFLFLLECRKGGRSGLVVESVLLVENEKGEISREMEDIYGDYRENQGWKK